MAPCSLQSVLKIGVTGNYLRNLIRHYAGVNIGDTSWCHYLAGDDIDISSHLWAWWGFARRIFAEQQTIRTSSFRADDRYDGLILREFIATLKQEWRRRLELSLLAFFLCFTFTTFLYLWNPLIRGLESKNFFHNLKKHVFELRSEAGWDEFDPGSMFGSRCKWLGWSHKEIFRTDTDTGSNLWTSILVSS